eukprot:TRINITY_DN7238_c0_g1_i1.p1 TRINITY_DN7238_c0_g1~~TRINITY_DN7238_c0_g1_i1.p1  ORF type:complete len:214 (-),score=28.18 TRINITY_DN7238_c0_g1_i1:129-770(-)
MDESCREVCIKLEPIGECEQVKNEEIILEKLNGCEGVPQLLFSGKTTTYFDNEYYAIVTNVVGEYSLVDLAADKDDQFLQDVIYKCLEILKNIRNRGIIHRDIKPNHIVFRNGEPFIIDFGAAGEPHTDSLFETRLFSPALASFVPRDEASDIESLWYSLLFLRQELPWINAENPFEEMCLKLDHAPEKMKSKYPLLTAPFLEILDGFSLKSD